MKTIPITFKKIEVTDYFPQLEEYKIRILLNDGADKAFERQEDIKDASAQVDAWFREIREKLKQRHSQLDLEDHPLAGHVVLQYTQEEDKIMDQMARFLNRIKETIRSSKMNKDSYYDMQMKIRNKHVEF
ncbi:hypothetical protein KY329_05635 [Candidatus Woesearchaeota archaeon]|nr:hypothetical protein [Candidatus Woesearchaeota archaeon]